MKITAEAQTLNQQTLKALQDERLMSWNHWRELADHYLPRRYVWLLSATERNAKTMRNSVILDGHGTKCARTLASGMMNGITSPSRPWFKLRISGFEDDLDYDARVWLDDVERRMMLVMASSNFYNALATMYLDLVVFGTACMLIYEDFENVIHCFNPALGEFYLAQDDKHKVNTIARTFKYKVHQVVKRWGKENCSTTIQAAYEAGGARLQEEVEIAHLIQPNGQDGYGSVAEHYKFRECYWEARAAEQTLLDEKGYHDFPALCPRWDLTGNDSYGTSPAMDAFADVVQLQHETKRKAQGLDKTVSPPMLGDINLKHQPTANIPGGITWVANLANMVGMKPAYTVNVPFAELSDDIAQIQNRIAEFFFNDLFRMISQLETVRSATEIDARREEKLVLLGPVLERFENEALDPAINRIFNIMLRAKLIPPPPQSIRNAPIEIQYVSILASAQRAVATVATERWVTFGGQLAGAVPKILNIPDWDTLYRDYGRDLGVPMKYMRKREDSEADTDAQNQQLQDQQAAVQGDTLVKGAKTLSETDVGGGGNALQQLLAAG